MSSDPVNLSELCVACGLCCTGAVFSHAKLSDTDKEILRKSGTKAGDGTYTGERLHLPCNFLNGSACSIYDKGRPKVCGEYLCKLARQVEDGKIEMVEAKTIAAEARRLLEAASAGLPKVTNIATGAKTLVEGVLPDGDDRTKHIKARLAYVALQTLIDNRIRTSDQKWIKSSDKV